MSYIRHIIITATVLAAASLLPAGCTDEEPVCEAKVVYPELSFSVSKMSMTPDTRAIDPMSPDIEKYVTTIAVFEFDNEGLHDKSANTYHFIDYLKGTVDGVKNVGDVVPTEFGVVESSLKGMSFLPYDSCKICLVANVTEEQVDSFYTYGGEPGQSYGRITFDSFTKWALPFAYKTMSEGTYDESETGHIETMYMFGYYNGSIDPAKSGNIAIDLGRLASRLDITIVNETGKAIDKRFGYHLDNVCGSAYFFPIKNERPAVINRGLARTVICTGVGDPLDEDVKHTVPETFPAGETHTRYYYVAAHSASGIEEATMLHLFYDARIVDDAPGQEETGIKIPLCNVHGSEADNVINGYSLSRNTRYHFTIRLKEKGAASGNAAKMRQATVCEGQPGEFVVYLP